MTRGFGSRLGAVATVLALGVGAVTAVGEAPAVAKEPSSRAAAEAKKLDAVATPKLGWYRCFDTAECATADVPRDYDQPGGAKVEVALLRIRARDQKHRIGSLFVNPGGPGGSATLMALFSSGSLSPKVLDRFDVVGMDPRGVGFSDTVRCLSQRTQASALRGYGPAFPVGSRQEKAWIASDKALGRGCSKDALATSMSTAEVARDMELMRRAVGDKQLTYFGYSYGTYLGQVYASLFPDRFRAIAVDGVLDPVAWAGDTSSSAQPLELRLGSSSGAFKALREILVRCDKVGAAKCAFAAGNPVANLTVIADRLRAKPLVIEDDEDSGGVTFTYQDLVVAMLAMLYDPAGYQPLVEMLADLWTLTKPPNPATRETKSHRAAGRDLVQVSRTMQDGRPRWGFPYDNDFDALTSVTCTDGTDSTTSAQYPGFAAQADARAPYFGRAWLWISSVCARDAFTGQDEDAYTGPFDTRTKAPVLFVGSYYDPATSYAGAVRAAKRLPNSRLLSSDSFGHTAYGTSSCTTKAVDTYLLTGTLPRAGKVCVGDVQPFQADAEDLAANRLRQQSLRRQLAAPGHLRR